MSQEPKSDPSLRAGLEHLIRHRVHIERKDAADPSSEIVYVACPPDPEGAWVSWRAVADLLRAQPPEPIQKLVEVWQKKRPDECEHIFNLADWSDREIVGRICWKCGEKQPITGRAQPLPAPDPRTCQWALDDVDGDSVYETQCGHSFQFNDGGATENEFRFCGYCGGQIVDARTSEDVASPPAVEGTRPPAGEQP